VNRQPSRWQLTIFALLWMAVAVLLHARSLSHGHTWLAEARIVAGLLAPASFVFGWEGVRRLYVGACYAAYPLGWVVSHLVLAAVYFAIFTPAGWLLRRFQGDPLQREFKPDAPTYWIPRGPAPEARSYFRQS
jgi:hypothetical protein